MNNSQLNLSGGTAVLIVPLLIVDLKPGVYDAPLYGLRGLTSTISSERRLKMPSTLHCALLFGKYRLLLASADENSVQTALNKQKAIDRRDAIRERSHSRMKAKLAPLLGEAVRGLERAKWRWLGGMPAQTREPVPLDAAQTCSRHGRHRTSPAARQ
jgi:hypothetical protein